jgi:predicted ATPase
MSLDLLLLGFLEEARRCSEQSLQEARELSHPTSLCFANSVATRVRFIRRDQHAVAEHGAMVRRLAREQGLGLWQALGNIYWGWSRVEAGNPAEGIALVRQGLAQYGATGAGLSRPFYLATLGIAHASMGNYAEALNVLAEAMQAGEIGEEHWMDSEIHRLTGEVLLSRSRKDEARAETELITAIAVAQQQGAKLWEIRAATSLARLWRLHDRRADARNLLAPVYEWFTEGFDAADLKNAKALLDELESRNASASA